MVRRIASISPLTAMMAPNASSNPAQGLSSLRRSDGVAGRFGGVLAAGWGGPPEGAVGKLIDVPPGVLLEPMVATALGAAITQTREATGLVRGVVLEVTGGGRAPTDGAGAGGVPDLSQVPQLDPGVVALGRKAVVAAFGGDRVERDD